MEIVWLETEQKNYKIIKVVRVRVRVCKFFSNFEFETIRPTTDDIQTREEQIIMNLHIGKRNSTDDINERRKRRRTISNDLNRGKRKPIEYLLRNFEFVSI